MDILEKKNHFNNLYDYYKNLLTAKQQMYFESYYFDDLSLAEIADIHQVSRNAIFDQLKKIYALLEDYEVKLGLFNQFKKRVAIYEEYSKTNNVEVLQIIEKLKNVE